MRGIPVKAVPVRVLVKSMPYRKAVSVKTFSEIQQRSRLEKEIGDISPVWVVPRKNRMKFRREWAKSPELRESDQEQSSPVRENRSRSLKRATSLIQERKTMLLFHTDGLITFHTWDNRMISCPNVKEVSLQEESESRPHGGNNAHFFHTKQTNREQLLTH